MPPLAAAAAAAAAAPAEAATATSGAPASAASAPGPDASAAAVPSRSCWLVFNPVAGNDDPAHSLGEVALALSRGYRVTVVQTTPELGPEAIARAALEAKADVVVASGGDGTVGAVAGVLAGTGVPLGVVPRGTANAFASALQIPTPLDDAAHSAAAAAEVVLAGHVRTIDTALATTSDAPPPPPSNSSTSSSSGSGDDGDDDGDEGEAQQQDGGGCLRGVADYPLILLLGVGFEADTVEGASRNLKDAVGPLAYVLAGLKQLLAPGGARNFRATAALTGADGARRVVEGDAAAITVANAAPPFSVLAQGHGEVLPDDGLLEVIAYAAEVGGAAAAAKNAVNLAWLFAGATLSAADGAAPDERSDMVHGGRFREVAIECDPPQKVVLDGELLGMTPVRVRVVPASLKVFVPPPPPPPPPPAEEEGEEEGAADGGGSKVTSADVFDLAE